jgi:hypothetical protein
VALYKAAVRRDTWDLYLSAQHSDDGSYSGDYCHQVKNKIGPSQNVLLRPQVYVPVAFIIHYLHSFFFRFLCV